MQLSAAVSSREESASTAYEAATERDAAVRSSKEAEQDLQRALDECQSLREDAEGAAARLQQVGEEVAEAREEAGREEAGRAQAAREVTPFLPLAPPERQGYAQQTVVPLPPMPNTVSVSNILHARSNAGSAGISICCISQDLLRLALQNARSRLSRQVHLVKVC